MTHFFSLIVLINIYGIVTAYSPDYGYSKNYNGGYNKNYNSRYYNQSPKSYGKPSSSSGARCPSSHSTGQYPYPSDCGSFVNCWNGKPHVQQCGPGTLFNPKTRVCDWPNNVKCDYKHTYDKKYHKYDDSESEESKCDDCDDSHHSEEKKESLKDTIDNKKKKVDDKLLKEILEHMSKLKH